MQVVQFLLAKNYVLTALELLVESQQAGRGDEVAELRMFFSDPDKFPQEELSRHQTSNGENHFFSRPEMAILMVGLCTPALDMQTQAKEREDKLQLLDYELKLAKEDLAEMRKRLEQVMRQANQEVKK